MNFLTYTLAAFVLMSNLSLQIQLRKPFTLKIPVMLPIGGKTVPLGEVCTEPVKLILEMVNNRSDILPNYNLIIDALDHECQASMALREIYPYFYADRVVPDALSPPETFNPRLHMFPTDRRTLFPTATTAYVPPIVMGGLCSPVCSVVGRTLQFFDLINVSPSFGTFLFHNLHF